MNDIKKELAKAVDDLKQVILRAVEVAYHEGYRYGYDDAMGVIQAIIDDDERRPS